MSADKQLGGVRRPAPAAATPSDSEMESELRVAATAPRPASESMHAAFTQSAPAHGSELEEGQAQHASENIAADSADLCHPGEEAPFL